MLPVLEQAVKLIMDPMNSYLNRKDERPYRPFIVVRQPEDDNNRGPYSEICDEHEEEAYLSLSALTEKINEDIPCSNQKIKKILIEAGVIKNERLIKWIKYLHTNLSVLKIDVKKLMSLSGKIDGFDDDDDDEEEDNKSHNYYFPHTNDRGGGYCETIPKEAPATPQCGLAQSLRLLADPSNSIVNTSDEEIYNLPIVIKKLPGGIINQGGYVDNSVQLHFDNLVRKINEIAPCSADY